MICPTCGTDAPRFDIFNTASKIDTMLRNFPLHYDFQSSAVTQMLLDAENDSQRYDTEIYDLKLRLSNLIAKQTELQKQIARMKSLTAPIRRLPIEVLCHLFSLFCMAYPVFLSDWCFGAHSRRRPPFALSSVCAGWRQIVINTSRLWCNIDISVMNAAHVPHFIQPLQFCLERSKSSPLTLDIRLGINPSNSLSDMCIDQSARWQHVVIVGDVNDSKFPNLSCGRSFPLLESLAVFPRSIDDPDLHLFNNAPRLRSLQLCAIPSEDNLLKFSSRTRITHLELDCDYDDFVFDELEMFPNLKSVIYLRMSHKLIPSDVCPQTSQLSAIKFNLYDYNEESKKSTRNHD
ncbi:hypothetical protein D9758_001658 [Tetrapyrgos nigripes]|uniref:F-box domain-containing protein n=1 Tax=Tetrapyrgos nigripes TaxID=182062 RepID=A0A8H5GXX9_9AGAR|nr:hypothetical protein D9758_001658 [Tetrapyrgos nigripes]